MTPNRNPIKSVRFALESQVISVESADSFFDDNHFTKALPAVPPRVLTRESGKLPRWGVEAPSPQYVRSDWPTKTKVLQRQFRMIAPLTWNETPLRVCLGEEMTIPGYGIAVGKRFFRVNHWLCLEVEWKVWYGNPKTNYTTICYFPWNLEIDWSSLSYWECLRVRGLILAASMHHWYYYSE